MWPDRRFKGWRTWVWKVLTIAALHYLTFMALPLTLLELGSRFVAVPVVAGFVLEFLRSAVRRRLRREVRAASFRDAAQQALDKRVVVPESNVDSAFWAAQLAEYIMTVDVPALLAAVLAAISILVLAAPSIGARAMGWLLTFLLFAVAFAVWSNRRRASAVAPVIEHRQRTAAWIAAAERDCGEIYGPRASGPFLAQLGESIEQWSLAEDRVERKHLQHRLTLGALLVVGLVVILRANHIDPLHLQQAVTAGTHSNSGLLLLCTGIPVAYVCAVHIESLLSGYAALTELNTDPEPAQGRGTVLERPPSRLTARALSFSYAGSPRAALQSIAFDVDLGNIALITAANGTGKTTLARLICGVVTPDAGNLEIDGIPCHEISRDNFSFVPQNPLIIEALSIEENVRLVAPNVSTDAMDRLLLELGLRRSRHDLAGELSRGEQRRMVIARAILKDPRVLLLDEPDVWLDDEGRVQLARVLDRELANRAIILVSHLKGWLLNEPNLICFVTQESPCAEPSPLSTGRSSACG